MRSSPRADVVPRDAPTWTTVLRRTHPAPPSPTLVYQRILGHPFVYDVVRPWVVGGLDPAILFAPVPLRADDVVFDVGCGTGVALDHLPRVARYVGYDVDPVAIARARKRAPQREEPTELIARAMTAEDVATHAPTVALLVGVLHHLSDADAIALLRDLATSPRLRFVYSVDVAIFPGRHVNNLLARLDRGRFVRRPPAYESLAARAGLHVDRVATIGVNGDGSTVSYLAMTMVPPRDDAR